MTTTQRSRADLLPYQERAIDFLTGTKKGALWADMGLGKTVTTLTAVQELRRRFDFSRGLIVAPKRVSRKTWQDELGQWSHLSDLKISSVLGSPKQRLEALEEKADLYVIGRDNFVWLTDIYRPKGRKWRRRWDFDTVILDESTTFKSLESQRTKAIQRVMHHLPYAQGPTTWENMIQLTGSPASNSLIHLWSQIYLLDGGARLGDTMGAYKARWFEEDPDGYGWIPKDHARDEILDRVRDIVFVLREEDYLDLPPIKFNPVPVYLSSQEMKTYRELKRKAIAEIVKDRVVRGVNAGALWGKLLQLAGGAVYDEMREVIRFHDHKERALLELIDVASGPTLVFYWFQHSLARIEAALRKAKVNYRVIRTEQDEDDWNYRKFDVGLLNPQSAGHGLNLQRGGDTITWFDLTQDLELWNQANARLFGGHRRAGKNPVLNLIVAEGTIDERVLTALQMRDDGERYLKNTLKRVVADA